MKQRMPTMEDVRLELAKAFPGTRFFVSRDKAGIGVWYWAFRIRWVEGPPFEAVRAAADKMQETGVSIRCVRETWKQLPGERVLRERAP
jgi:hypothetical protein